MASEAQVVGARGRGGVRGGRREEEVDVCAYEEESVEHDGRGAEVLHERGQHEDEGVGGCDVGGRKKSVNEKSVNENCVWGTLSEDIGELQTAP